MKIVIIGDGKVGHKLAVRLSEEDYDIVLIDQNEEKLKESLTQMDIFCIVGNGADVEVLKQADVPHADLVIACTSSDEINMLTCLLSKRLGAKNTAARVRSPLYYKQIDLLKEDMRLTLAVNPELTMANEIARVIVFPEASKVETFMKGRVELVESAVKDDSQLIGLSLAEIYRKFQIKVLICAVKREGEVYIPDGNFVVRKGDKLHMAASHKSMEAFFKAAGRKVKKTKNVLILGGGHVSYYLASQLLQTGSQVKIIERKLNRCQELCELLPKATIIHGDATDHDLLIEEGIDRADAVVSLTGMDEENIIVGLFAKSLGVDKIVAKVNEDARVHMVEKLGIDSVISAKSTTADVIMSYIKARKNSYENENIETMYRLLNGKVEALEFIIKKESEYTNVPLKELKMKKNNLIACIGRDRKVIIPNGDDHLEVGDSVIVVTMDSKVNHFSDMLK